MSRTTKTAQRAQARPASLPYALTKRTPRPQDEKETTPALTSQEDERQAALAIHAPCAVRLAQQGLALAEAWPAFARYALARDPRQLPEARRLDATFQAGAPTLRTVCEALSDGASRPLVAPPKEDDYDDDE